MKFLIDTNVFIPLEPTNPSEEEFLPSFGPGSTWF
jgi:hypothetical protein